MDELVTVCIHVAYEKRKPDVLCCDDDGTVTYAVCVECANRIEDSANVSDDAAMENLVACCHKHLAEHGIPEKMPAGNFWLLKDDGSGYRPQVVN